MATFVLVHGAWAGGWSWVRVVDRLVTKGHRVFAPTLSGVGERSHLAGCGINLTTHVNDVVNEIRWKDLDQIVLVGHSYGGMVITGVAEQIGERIAAIVYVDAFIPGDGESMADIIDWHPTGLMTSAPPSGDDEYDSEADRAWVDGKATPQPTASITERLHVSGAYQKVPRKVFVDATGTPDTVRADASWTVHEIACGHDIPILRPDELAAILEAAAQ